MTEKELKNLKIQKTDYIFKIERKLDYWKWLIKLDNITKEQWMESIMGINIYSVELTDTKKFLIDLNKELKSIKEKKIINKIKKFLKRKKNE